MFCDFSVLLFVEILVLFIKFNKISLIEQVIKKKKKFSVIVHTHMSMGIFPETNIDIEIRDFELQFHLFC